jgi:hypothetical protein
MDKVLPQPGLDRSQAWPPPQWLTSSHNSPACVRSVNDFDQISDAFSSLHGCRTFFRVMKRLNMSGSYAKWAPFACLDARVGSDPLVNAAVRNRTRIAPGNGGASILAPTISTKGAGATTD